MTNKCIIAMCSRPAKCRGLCLGCYKVAWTLIRDGDTTWEKLVKNGMADEPAIQPSPFRAAFNKPKKKGRKRIPWDRMGI